MSDNLSRRQFLASALAFVFAGKGASNRIFGPDGDVELCLLRCNALLTYSEPWIREIANGGPGGMNPKGDHLRGKAESDYLEALEPGDILGIDAFNSGGLHPLAIGDTGVTPIRIGKFMEPDQVELLEMIASELSFGTQMYAVVEDVLTMPEPKWFRSIWISVHAAVTEENAMRLAHIANSELAASRRNAYKEDASDTRTLYSLHDDTLDLL